MKQPIWVSILWLVQIPVWILLIADELPTLSERAMEGFRFGGYVILLLFAVGFGLNGVVVWFHRRGKTSHPDEPLLSFSEQNVTLGFIYTCSIVIVPVLMAILFSVGTR